MKVGSMTVPLQEMPLRDALSYLKALGIESVEIGTGGFPGNRHCNPAALLKDKKQQQEFLSVFRETGLELNAFSCHSNPIHPNVEVAKKADEDFVATCKLAQELGVKKVITFSGCAGDSPASAYPNWVTCPWPEDFLHVLEYQWNECLLPYWEKAGKLAKASGVKVAFEMHPGFQVYNTSSMLRLRKELGITFGANLDPSHLIWQGNDIIASIRELQGAIYHFHAKDTKIDAINTARKGVLDTTPYDKELERSWIFRTLGYGHGQDYWKDIISTLRLVGYDDVISIEHEDSLMSVEEGLKKAVAVLQEIIILERPAPMWWA